jgi:hypothetical protein
LRPHNLLLLKHLLLLQLLRLIRVLLLLVRLPLPTGAKPVEVGWCALQQQLARGGVGRCGRSARHGRLELLAREGGHWAAGTARPSALKRLRDAEKTCIRV